MTESKTLTAILQSTSDALFHAGLGDKPVTMDSRSADGDTPLHVLIWRNDTEGAVMLIEAGADVNAQGDMGETPLHVAIRQRNAKVIETLLNAGAKKDIASEFGETPAALAKKKGMPLI